MQSKTASFIEVSLSTAIGYLVALMVTMTIFPLFGIQTTHGEEMLITLIFTIVSIIRSFFMRRVFNWLHTQGYLV